MEPVREDEAGDTCINCGVQIWWCKGCEMWEPQVGTWTCNHPSAPTRYLRNEDKFAKVHQTLLELAKEGLRA